MTYLTLKEATRLFQQAHIQNALERHNNVVTATARELGISQSRLSNKLKELGMRVAREPAVIVKATRTVEFNQPSERA
jgi:DNA-binding NtrC family response regulator